MDDVKSAIWRKSSYSGNNGGNCVEVASDKREVAVRDSKDSGGTALVVTNRQWRRFTDQVKAAR